MFTIPSTSGSARMRDTLPCAWHGISKHQNTGEFRRTCRSKYGIVTWRTIYSRGADVKTSGKYGRKHVLTHFLKCHNVNVSRARRHGDTWIKFALVFSLCTLKSFPVWDRPWLRSRPFGGPLNTQKTAVLVGALSEVRNYPVRVTYIYDSFTNR